MFGDMDKLFSMFCKYGIILIGVFTFLFIDNNYLFPLNIFYFFVVNRNLTKAQTYKLE